MPLKLVLDTNILVSGFLYSTGNESLVFDFALTPAAKLYVTKAILAEYTEVLSRPQFKIQPDKLSAFLQLIADRAVVVSPKRLLSASSDEADNRFLECAQAAQANFLVTGNKKHFPRSLGLTQIVNARELLELFTLDRSR